MMVEISVGFMVSPVNNQLVGKYLGFTQGGIGRGDDIFDGHGNWRH